MKKQLNLGFCILIYSDENKKINLEKEMLIKAYNLNKKLFKIKIPKFKIQLVRSREEFNKLWGFATKNFVAAFAKKNRIVIFSYDIFNKETTWGKKEFFKTLIHEINHLFYQRLRKNAYDPLWLSEGLATFMQHNNKKHNYKEKINITQKGLEQNPEDINIKSYQIFTTFVEYLILNFGRNKILKLILELRKRDKLNNIFQKIYKKSFKGLIEDANKYQKII